MGIRDWQNALSLVSPPDISLPGVFGLPFQIETWPCRQTLPLETRGVDVGHSTGSGFPWFSAYKPVIPVLCVSKMYSRTFDIDK